MAPQARQVRDRARGAHSPRPVLEGAIGPGPATGQARHEAGDEHRTSLARAEWLAARQRLRRRRQERAARPYPTALRRLRSLLGLVVVVVCLGVLVAALVGSVAVAIVIIGTHLVG